MSSVTVGGLKGARFVSEIGKAAERLEVERKSLVDLDNTIKSLAALKQDLSLRVLELQQLQRSALQETEAKLSKAKLGRRPSIYLGDVLGPNATAKEDTGDVLRIWNDLNFEEPSKGVTVFKKSTPEEVIKLTLKKYKINDDAKKYILIEVVGADERVVTDPPLALKMSLEAKGIEVKFFISKRVKEGAIRVYYDNAQGEPFKSLFVNSETTNVEVIKETVRKFNLPDQNPEAYNIVLINGEVERVLPSFEKPYDIVAKWTRRGEGDLIKLELRNIHAKTDTSGKSPKKPRYSNVGSASELKELKKAPENDFCADCDTADPDYISITFGTYICRQCAMLHQALSVVSLQADTKSLVRPILSVVRPVQMFPWPTHLLELMSKLGNGPANLFWENRLVSMGHKKTTPKDPMDVRETYLIKKYIDRLFCPANLSDFNDKALFAAIENDNVVKIHQLLAYGVSPNVTGGKLFTSPLHYTCKSGSVTASILLLYAGANPCADDNNFQTPLLFAAEKGDPDFIEILKDFQTYFQSSIRGFRQIDKYKTEITLAKMTALEWRKHWGDLLLQRDKRANATTAERLTNFHADEAFAKSLIPAYQEATYREMIEVYTKLFPVPPYDPEDDWYLSLRKKQAFECVSGGQAQAAPSFTGPSTTSVVSLPDFQSKHTAPKLKEDKKSMRKSTVTGSIIGTIRGTLRGSMSVRASVVNTTAQTTGPSQSVVAALTQASLDPKAVKEMLKEMSPAQRLEYEKLRLEEEKDRSAQEILARRKAAEEARALKIEEERRRELEQQRITEEMQLQLDLQHEKELSELAEMELLAAAGISESDTSARAQIEEENRKKKQELESENRRKKAELEAQDRADLEIRRKQWEKEREEAAERTRKQAELEQQARRRRDELEKKELERKIEEEKQEAEAARKFLEEQELMQKKQEEEEAVERERQRKLYEAQLSSSLAEVQNFASIQQQQRQDDLARLEKERINSLNQILDTYLEQLNQQTELVIASVKTLISASQGDVPSLLVQSTADAATKAHPLVIMAEDIGVDTRLNPELRAQVEQCGEKVMDMIRKIVTAAKEAARHHPARGPLDHLKASARDLLMSIKDFKTALEQEAQ